jgi:hypothetical protein
MRIPTIGRSSYARAVVSVDADGGGGAETPFERDEVPRETVEAPIREDVPRDVVDDAPLDETAVLKVRAREIVAPFAHEEGIFDLVGIDPWEDPDSVRVRAKVVVAEVTGTPWRSPFAEERMAAELGEAAEREPAE